MDICVNCKCVVILILKFYKWNVLYVMLFVVIDN